MKIDFISDIHLDFWIKEKNKSDKLNSYMRIFIESVLKPLDGDVLCLAGDTGHYFVQDTALLTELKKFYKHIIIVRGNHDMYLVSKAQQKLYGHCSSSRVLEMKRWCKDNDIHYLDGDEIVIEGVRFGGVGMWYDLPSWSKIDEWKAVMNDSNLIMEGSEPHTVSYGYGGSEKITTFDTQKYYLEEVEKLKKMQCDVLLTHVPPILIPDELKGDYSMDRTNIFYESDNIDNVEQTGTRIVISGHVHNSFDFELDETWFLINPLGYKSDNTCNSIKQIEFIE